jgi:hypothetical protein
MSRGRTVSAMLSFPDAPAGMYYHKVNAMGEIVVKIE